MTASELAGQFNRGGVFLFGYPTAPTGRSLY